MIEGLAKTARRVASDEFALETRRRSKPSYAAAASIDVLLIEKAREAGRALEGVGRNLSALPPDVLENTNIYDDPEFADVEGYVERDSDGRPMWSSSDEEDRILQLQRALNAQVMNELDLVTTRLLSDHAELHSQIDRLRAESELRFALSVPLAALFGVLAIRWSWWWLAGLLAIALLVQQGRRSAQDAADATIDALMVGTVQAPSFERLRRSTDETVQRIKEEGGGSKKRTGRGEFL